MPTGWSQTSIGDVALLLRNGLFASRPVDRPPGTRILRISAVRGGGVDLEDAKYVRDLPPDQAERYQVREGDLLFTRYNGSRRLVGICGRVGPHEVATIHPDKLIRVVVDPAVADGRFVALQMAAPATRRFLGPRIRTTAGQSGISGKDLRAIPVFLPTLEEQRRIVGILEEHLSRLGAAQAGIASAERRLTALHKSMLLSLIPDVADYPADWKASIIGKAGKVDLGRQRHPDWHTGPSMRPYLRVANVFEARIDTRSLYEMHWPGDTFDRFRLLPGDVLLNEGQTPELLGRSALYQGDPAEVAFTNSLLRFRASDDVLPEFALLVFRRHMHAGRFTTESRITTNIAHLSAARLKRIEFPIPPLPVQEELVTRAEEQLSALTRVGADTAVARSRSAGLRRALLAAAFSGRLT